MPRRTRGRYVEDPKIRSMRVRSWFRAVTRASRLRPAELEEKFSERSPGKSNSLRSCIWDKYRRGETVPRGGRGRDGRPNLVDRVEKSYPGTAKWLLSPLWRLADKAPMEMSEIRSVYDELPSLIRSMFIAPPEQATGVFWRRPVDAEHVYDVLFHFHDLDAFIATLAMIKEAETIQSQAQHQSSVAAAQQYLYLFRDIHIISKTVLRELAIYLNSHWNVAGYFDVDEPTDDDDE